jgi:hypothetical protein
LKLHSDLAKACSGLFVNAADDAQFASVLQEQWLYSGAAGHAVTLLAKRPFTR